MECYLRPFGFTGHCSPAPRPTPHAPRPLGAAVLPCAELGIHGQKAGAATGREKSEKRGVQAARNGPSLPSTPAGGPVAKAEMSTADRLGSREVVTRSCGCTCYDWSYDQDVTQCATTGTPPMTCGQSNPTVRSSWDNVISPDPGGRVSRERTRRLPAPRRSVARVDGMANCVPVSDTVSILAVSPFPS